MVVSSTTTYTKEHATIALADLAVGQVVHVAGTPASGSNPSSSSSSSARPVPGTGSVDATRVSVVLPTFAGRVSAVGSGGYTLVGRDGALLHVSTSASTKYYDGTSSASSSAVTVGTRIVAEGTRTSVTQLNADVVTVVPAPGLASAGRKPGP